ncbi:MAG: DUF2147 domain-containing protein [Sphingomicrobium sp.]
MLLWFVLVTTAAVEVSSIEGSWTNPSASVTVTIAPCGETICGRVTAASDQAKADARKAGTDPLIEVELMSGFKPNGPGRWKGRLFVPDLKRRSKAELRLAGPDQLKVTGCAVGRILCKSQLWTRVAAETR